MLKKLGILFFCLIGVATAAPSMTEYQQEAIALYNKMTLEEKVGQLLLPTYRLLATAVSQPAGKAPGYLCQQVMQEVHPANDEIFTQCGLNQIITSKIGAVLADGGPYYNSPTLKNWAMLNARAVRIHHGLPHDPLLLVGSDAIHGNNHVEGAVIFPHNINLGVTHDAALVKEIGELTGKDVLASGFNWAYMPTVAIAHDLRWGRFYESFGQDPQLVKKLGQAYVEGFQHLQQEKITGVLASVKHFIGDGATQYGLDEGDANFAGNAAAFWRENGAGYEGALQGNVLNLMVSYSAINGDRMHFGGQWDTLNIFKHKGVVGSNGKRYIFPGFAVSDYNGPTRAAYFYNLNPQHSSLNSLPEIFAKSINAGVDMIMLGNGDTKNPFDVNSPFNYTSVKEAADALTTACKMGLISENRLKEAVTRILAVKLAMGAKKSKQSYPKLQAEERALALKVAQESLVLLKNDKQTLPIQKKAIKNIVFLGETNDLGVQNGGWTINWQGQKGNKYFTGKDQISSGAHTIEQALTKKLSAQVFHQADVANNIQKWSAANTIVVAVVAEPPYAEYMGDIGNPHEVDQWYEKGIKSQENSYMPPVQSQNLQLEWSAADADAIEKLRAKGIRIITVVFSGRPLVLTSGKKRAPLLTSDALIAAFLPGTLGGDALANAITGSYEFHKDANGLANTLTFPWPRNREDVTEHFAKGALFPIGYGLSFNKKG